MAKLVTLLEQHLDRQPRTVVTKATTCLEAILARVYIATGKWSGSEPTCERMLCPHMFTCTKLGKYFVEVMYSVN